MAQAAEQKKEEADAKLCRSVAVDDLGPCKKAFTIEVGPATVKEAIEETLGDLRKTAVIPGFRAGKAPRDIIEKRFAKDVEADVKGDLIEKALHEAVEGKGWTFLRHPHVDEKSVEFDPAKGLKFKAEILIWPQFEAKGYQGLALKRPKPAVTDDEVAQGIDDLRKRKAQWIPAEGGAQPTDLVIGKVTLSVDGEAPISRDGFTVLLEEGMVGEIPVEDLGKKFAGKKAGDEVALPIQVPVTFTAENLRGKKGTLAVAVDEVKRARLPEVNEDLARQFHAESVAAFKDTVRQAILREKERMADLEVERQIHDQLAKAMPFDLPEEAVVAESHRILRRYQRELMARGFPPESIEEKVREVQKHSREEAEKRLKSLFILERVAEKERIYATEQELEKYVAAIAASSGQRPEKLRSEFARDGSLDEIRTQLRHAKVVDFVKTKAKISEG